MSYPHLMPPNPRLVKRVATALGMLMVLRADLSHDQPDDALVRAAVLLVRFPDLVDQLIDAPEAPPVNGPSSQPHEVGDQPDGQPGSVSAAEGSHPEWDSPEVRRITEGYTAADLALCFGRAYAPEPVPAEPDRPAEA